MTFFKKTAIAGLCICAAMGFAVLVPKNDGVSAKTNAEIQSEIDSLTGKKDKINKEQNNLKLMIKNAKASANTLSNEITNLTYEVALIDEQLLVMTELLEKYDALTAEQGVQIAALEKKIEKEQRMLDDMIRMSYEYGGTGSAVEFIFSAEDFTDLLSRIDLLGYHLSYNNKVLDNYNTSLADLEKTKSEYEAAKVVMNEYKTEQEALRAQYEEASEKAAQKRAAALASADEYEKELATKQAYINELNDEIKSLAAMFAKEDSSTYSGIFAFPVPAGVYRITSYYGYRKDPFTGKTAYHNGYDFACANGTDIYAADDGTVVLAKWNGGYGNCVTINHGGGVMSLYGHCSSLNVVAGQTVKRGEVIAKVGSTGRSTGNHLHFTVYKNGVLVDPANYVTIK